MTDLERAFIVEQAAGTKYGDQHDGFYKSKSVLDLFWRPIEDFLGAKRLPVLRVADIGCGSGLVGLAIESKFAERGHAPQMVFIDANEAMLNAIPKSEKRTIVVANVSELPVALYEAPPEIIVGRQFIHYSPPESQAKIFRNLFLYLRKGGLFVHGTGTHEDEEVVRFQTAYLNGILAHRNPQKPAQRYYQTVHALEKLMEAVGLRDVRTVAAYTQKSKPKGFYDYFGFNQTGMGLDTFEQKMQDLLIKLDPSEKVKKALNIQSEGSAHSVALSARIMVATK